MSREATFQLLQLKEKIQDNLSSGQIAGTLDELLMRAIAPLLQHTQFVEWFVVDVLPYSVSNSRRKLSNSKRVQGQPFHDALFSVVLGADKGAKLEIFRKLSLERSVYFMMLNTFQDVVKDYEANLVGALEAPGPAERAPYVYRMQQVEQRVGYAGSASDPAFFSVVRQVRFWAQQAADFKNMIIEKYVRFAYQQSVRAYKATGMTIDRDDLFRDLILAVSRAIDKFDIERGALTRYVQWWMLDGVTNHRNPHQYGTAYTIPTAQRKKMTEGASPVSNLSVSLDELMANGGAETGGEDGEAGASMQPTDHADTVLQAMIERENESLFHMIAIRSDRHRVASLVHGLRYAPTARDRMLLASTLRA